MVLGKLPPSPNSNANPKPNPDPDRGQFSGHRFLHGSENCEVYFFIYVYETFLRFVSKKYDIHCWIMGSRPKRKFTTLREQDALLEAFYNELDEGEMDDDHKPR